MNFKRRLLNLENRPFKRPIQKPRFSELDERIRKKLGLPLPQNATDAERAEGLRLLRAAIHTMQKNCDDQTGLDALRDFALSLHRQHQTTPYWGWPE